ncbi:MAG: OmpA family protein, partial [Myxococcales bacterium]
ELPLPPPPLPLPLPVQPGPEPEKVRTVQAVMPSDAPVAETSARGTGSKGSPLLSRLHVAATVFGEVISRQVGGELGASFAVLPWLDAGALATLGDRVGARVTAAVHPSRSADTRFAPFAQARLVFHPVDKGIALGGGAWAGGSMELGPGRVQAGALGELYRGPPGYFPYAVVAMLGYELDPFQMAGGEVVVQEKVVEKVVVQEKVVEREVKAPEPTTGVIRARVMDLEDRPLKAKLTVKPEGGQEQQHEADPELELTLPPGQWQLSATADGYLVRGRTLSLKAGETLVLEFPLRPVPKQSSAELTRQRIEIRQQIHFALNEARILSESHGVLDEVVDILLRNPFLTVRIEGHTDETGGSELNQRLSEARAKSVRDHLVERGVAAARLSTQGFGSSRPLVKQSTEEARARNRRVQFEIVP